MFFKAGSSDKEYHLYCSKHDDGKYSVHCEYGRRPNANQTHDKTAKGRLSLSGAWAIFEKIEKTQRDEGYRDLPTRRPAAKIPGATLVPVKVDSRPAALAKHLELYVRAEPEVEAAGRTSLALMTSTGLSGATAETTTIMCALLGDIACSSQDYLQDAIEAITLSFEGPPLGWLQLAPRLSNAILMHFENARDEVASDQFLEDFAGAALAPSFESFNNIPF